MPYRNKFPTAYIRKQVINDDWWEEYRSNEKDEPYPGRIYKEFELWEEDYNEDKNQVCSHFKCGRNLTIQEKLYGTKCQEHSGEKDNICPTNDNMFSFRW